MLFSLQQKLQNDIYCHPEERCKRRRISENESGVSLVELLLVIAIIGFLGLLIGNLPNSLGLIGKAKRASLAREIVSAKIESLRQTGYINLANGQTSISDLRINELPQGLGLSKIEDCDPLICTQAENTKEVSVSVSWKDLGKDEKMEVKTLVSEGGL